MIIANAIGFVASALVLAAFCMKEIIPLRFVAVCSNVAFLIYGLALGLIPVWLLHAALLPINCWRLWEGLAQPSLERSGPLLPARVGRILRRRDDC